MVADQNISAIGVQFPTAYKHNINKEKSMEKKIYVSEKNKAHLRKVFGCSTMMVWKALNFKSDSELAKKIRYTALTQLNGTPNWKQADVETTHEEVEKTMTQRYGERIKLVYDRNDGSTSILVDGKVTRKEQDLSIPAFMKLQSEVEIMAMSL